MFASEPFSTYLQTCKAISTSFKQLKVHYSHNVRFLTQELYAGELSIKDNLLFLTQSTLQSQCKVSYSRIFCNLLKVREVTQTNFTDELSIKDNLLFLRHMDCER
ncbi:hypothetical protein V6Z11_D09G034300 [Gossypium hirsutum]